MSLPDGADWSRQVGHGPAREACLSALFMVEVGREAAETPGILDAVDPEGLGFAWEGLGTAGAPLPAEAPPVAGTFWRLGVGMALALRRLGGEAVVPDDPDVADGMGFLSGVLRTLPCLQRGFGLPPALDSAADRGLGRALWFVYAGRPTLIAAAVRFAGPERARALWTGVGRAAVYTAGGTPEGLAALRATGDAGALAEGAEVARQARRAHGGLGEEHAAAAAALTG